MPDPKVLDEIVDLLAPLTGSEAERRAQIGLAFGTHSALQSRIDFSGAQRTFLVNLIMMLDQYGEVEPGKPALCALLETARSQVGKESQEDLSLIIEQLLAQSVARGDQVFISYARANRPFVERLISDFQTNGLKVWIDQQGLKPGTRNWDTGIRQALKASYAVVLVASAESRRSDYVQDELAVAEMFNRPVIPVWALGTDGTWPDCVPLGMVKRQYIDMRGAHYAANLPALLTALREPEAAADIPEPAALPVGFEPKNPYKGLNPFTSADRHLFFGRSTLTRDLVTFVEQPSQDRLLCVVGASGSGKSSLVWAGVLPALQDAHPDWVFLSRMVPGSNPLEALAASLSAAIPGALLPSLTRELGAEGDVRARALTQLAGQIATTYAAPRVVLFIDQFEELFTLTADEPTRQRFIDLLTAAVSERDGALTAILTLRADFYDRPLNYPSLGRLMESCAKDVLPLSLNDLYEVIQRPAALDTARLSFDDGLVAEMVFRVHEQAGALPLLQYTLDQLFEMRQDLKLTWEAYRLLGGVNGVLPKLAQQTYERLAPEEQRLTRALFLRLIEPGATELDTTRRRATMAELELSDPGQAKAIAEAAEAFTAARLLVKDSHDGVDTIEVAHEALIREWPTLRDWLSTARSDLVFQRAISAAAAAWSAAGRQPDDAGRLYRASMLADAEDWAKRAAPSSEEMAFIRASTQYQAAQVEAEKRRIAELKAATQARRRWVIRAAAVAALAVITIAIAAVVSYIAFQDRLAAEMRENQANIAVAEAQGTLTYVPGTISGAQTQVVEAQAQVVAANATLTPIPATLTQVAHAVATGEVRLTEVESQRLAALAQGLLDTYNNAETAALLGIRALRSANTSEAHTELGRATQRLYGRGILMGHTNEVLGGLALDDGRFLSWSADNTLRLWGDDGAPITVLEGHEDRVRGALELADGRLVSWSDDDTLRLWAADGMPLALLEGHEADVTGALALADGRLLSWSEDGTLRLWDEDETSVTVLRGHTADNVLGALALTDGRFLSWSTDYTLRLWSDDGAPLAVLEHAYAVRGALELDDGRLLSWSEDWTLRLWSDEGASLTVLEGHEDWVLGALELDDGRLLSWSEDDTLRLWTRDGTPLNVLEGHAEGVSGALELDDGQFLSWSSGDGTLRLWDTDGTPLGDLEGHSSVLLGVLPLNDGRFLSRYADGALRLWDWYGTPNVDFVGHTGEVTGALVLADGRFLTWSNDNTLRLWSENGVPDAMLEGHNREVTGVLALADGRFLSWSNDATLRLWSDEGTPLAVLEGHTEPVRGALALADGRFLSWSEDGTLRLRDTDGAPGPVFEGHTEWVLGALALADGRFLSWSEDYTLRLWSAEGTPLDVLEGHEDYVTGALALTDGRFLSWAEDGTLRLWSNSGTPLAVLEEHEDYVTGALALADGRFLSWSDDDTLRLWSADGAPLAVLVGHNGDVFGAITLADGRLLSWSGDGTLRLWTADGMPGPVFEGHEGWVRGALELRDGLILSWSDDTTLRLWYTDASRLLQYACTRVFRDFTAEERTTFRIDDAEPTCPQLAPVG